MTNTLGGGGGNISEYLDILKGEHGTNILIS